jgi:SAM-dependent methyltransferase
VNWLQQPEQWGGSPRVMAQMAAKRFALEPLAIEWQSMFLQLLEQKKTHPLNPYHPTKPYRAKPAQCYVASSELAAMANEARDKREALARTVPPQVKLNIACGPNIFPYPGWVNYDRDPQYEYWRFMRTGERHEMPEHQRALVRFLLKDPDAKHPVAPHDMTVRFPHEDNSVDYIYVGQAIEHMSRRTQVIPFLQECRRMLKPGGVLRMTTPDLDKLTEAYREGAMGSFDTDQPDWFKGAPAGDKLSYLMFGAAGPECTQTKYEGHFHLYTRGSMLAALKDAGFRMGAVSFISKPHPEVKDEGMSHSFAVEATK